MSAAEIPDTNNETIKRDLKPWNQYHIVRIDDYMVTDEKHEPIIGERIWESAQEKRNETDAKNEILGLVAKDYYKGPKQDLDPNCPGDIWEFKKDIDGIRFYVKVKIVQENEDDVLKCLGFHEDDFS